MAITELQTNLNEYNGSCNDKTAVTALAEEKFNPRLKAIDDQLASLDKRDQQYLYKKNNLIKKRGDILLKKINETDLLKKNGQTISKLYNLREASHNGLREGEQVEAKIDFDKQGNPFLTVSKQMDGAVGFDFTITGDGKVVFGAMGDDKMAEVIDFLYRRGITGFELPPGAPKTPEEVKQRQEDQIKLDKTVETVKKDAPVLEDNPRYIPKNGAENANAAMAETIPDNTNSAQAAGTTTSKGDSFDESHKKLREFAEKNKRENGKGLHINGDTFSFYKDNSRDWYKEDGKKDKKGVQQDLVVCRIQLHRGKDGKLSGLSYYVGNDGKLDPSYAGQMIGLLKDAGKSVIEFKGIPDADLGTLRTECAKKGIIPAGCLSPNKQDAINMMEEAAKKMGKDTQKYKDYQYKMGVFLEQEASKVNPPTDDSLEKLTYAKTLQKEKDYERMHEFYGPVLKTVGIKSKSNDPDRVSKAAGAANAAGVLFELFETHGDKSIPELLSTPDNGLDEEQIAALNRFNNPDNANLKIQKMSQEAWMELYHSLEKAEVKKARASAGDVRNTLSDAKKRCDNIIKTLQDKGHTKLYFDFDATKKASDAKADKTNEENNEARGSSGQKTQNVAAAYALNQQQSSR